MELSLMLDSRRSVVNQDADSNCPAAFARCLSNDRCRSSLQTLLTKCVWNQTTGGTCSRADCLGGVRRFYETIGAELATALVFCRCRRRRSHDDDNDDVCAAFRDRLLPTCAVVELPPPSCSDLLHRCTEDEDCRSRWLDRERNCGYDKNVGGCPPYALCRRSLVSVMGTLLTTNCTCARTTQHGDQVAARCADARQRLQQHNVCKDMAIHDFYDQMTVSTRMYSSAAATPSFVHSTEIPSLNLNSPPPGKSPRFILDLDCKDLATTGESSTISSSKLLRIYQSRDSDCSSLCQCPEDGATRGSCVTLPCLPILPCNGEREGTYDDGELFTSRERGNCSCLKGEVICAKSLFGMQQKEGLFIHVGYSLVEKVLIQETFDIKFTSARMTKKLTHLLNHDSQTQSCSLLQHGVYDGNVVYEISSTRLHSIASIFEGCVAPAKRLMRLINSRHTSIASDAELSILKVAQLERVQFHVHDATDERRSPPSPPSSSPVPSSSSSSSSSRRSAPPSSLCLPPLADRGPVPLLLLLFLVWNFAEKFWFL